MTLTFQTNTLLIKNIKIFKYIDRDETSKIFHQINNNI